MLLIQDKWRNLIRASKTQLPALEDVISFPSTFVFHPAVLLIPDDSICLVSKKMMKTTHFVHISLFRAGWLSKED
jgi:hypothetical protein